MPAEGVLPRDPDHGVGEGSEPSGPRVAESTARRRVLRASPGRVELLAGSGEGQLALSADGNEDVAFKARTLNRGPNPNAGS